MAELLLARWAIPAYSRVTPAGRLWGELMETYAWAPLRTALAPLHTQLGDDLPALDRDAVWLTRALATPVIQRHVPFSRYMRSASAWLLCNE